MKKGFYLFLVLSFSFIHSFAQSDIVTKTIYVFPYQKTSEATDAIAAMQSWNSASWKSFFDMLDDDSLQLKASYALHAFTNDATLSVDKKKMASDILSKGLRAAKTPYANELIIKELGLLGDDAAVNTLAGLLTNELYVGNASRALAVIKSNKSIAALNKALTKASGISAKHIQAALDNVNKPLPEIKNNQTTVAPTLNAVQTLLQLQDRMDAAKNPFQKKNILSEAAHIPGFTSFMFVAKSLVDPDVNNEAALITTRLALANTEIRGKAVRDVLEKSLMLLKGEDSAILSKKLMAHVKAMPYDNGFVSLFNGKDLTGWKALVGNPITRAKMSETDLQKAQIAANEKTKNDWIVKDGLLVFTGHGDNLATDKHYADFDMYVDWKITEKGDAGIYLRGTPQVQIWDTSRREVGAQVGSGGLYNNKINQSKPMLVADNKIGEWNTFHIVMIGDKVTVTLNGQMVTDNTTLENYWDKNLPIFPKEQIELQAHGTYVAYRNIYLKEITRNTVSVLSDEEKNQGFQQLFDGSNLNQWTGNTAGYLVEDAAIVVHPEKSGGNLYTKEEFANFNYRFEFQLTPGANNGLGIRAPLEGDAAYVGMELQILDNEAPIYKSLQPYQYHGSVYGVIPAKRGYLKPAGEWNKEEVIVNGSKVKVILNGETILDGDIKEASATGTMDHKEHPGLLRPSGHIGFLGHGDVVRFRNIRAKKM